MNRLMTKADRLAARRIPVDAYCVRADEAAAAYCYPVAGGRVGALCYRGSAGRPEVHTICRTIDQATELVAKWLLGVEESRAAKSARAAAKKAWVNPLTVGEILYTSWGYDQTNIDFYIVTRVSGRRVWVQPIAQDSETTGYMSGKCWPAMPIQLCGEESMHIAQPSGDDVYVRINGHHAHRERGQSHSFSSYA